MNIDSKLKELISAQLDIVRILEPKITMTLQELTVKYAGTLESLSTKFKDQGSCLRKAKQIVKSKMPPITEDDLKEVVFSIEDYLRYTIVFDEENFTLNTENVIRDLKEKAFETKKLINRFSDDKYKDIISWYETKEVISLKYAFELQFHTPDSFKKKKINHYLYEIIREFEVELNSIDPSIHEKLAKALSLIYEDVKSPKNVKRIKNIN